MPRVGVVQLLRCVVCRVPYEPVERRLRVDPPECPECCQERKAGITPLARFPLEPTAADLGRAYQRQVRNACCAAGGAQ